MKVSYHRKNWFYEHVARRKRRAPEQATHRIKKAVKLSILLLFGFVVLLIAYIFSNCFTGYTVPFFIPVAETHIGIRKAVQILLRLLSIPADDGGKNKRFNSMSSCKRCDSPVRIQQVLTAK